MTTFSSPLLWPQGWNRAKYRDSGWAFKIPYSKARDHLLSELRKLGAKNVVVSTNLPNNRSSGMPPEDSANAQIKDPGVAIYYSLRDQQMVMARDAYTTVAKNLRSIGLAIEAMRAIERHGGSTMMERAFSGFAQLEGPANAPKARPWWEFFDFEADPTGAGMPKVILLAGIEARYKSKAKQAHPDNGGTASAMSELNDAVAKAREVLA